MKKLLTLAIAATLASSSALAMDITVGQPLPEATISDGGEAIIVGGEVQFQTWAAHKLNTGIIVAQAAREEASALISEKFKADLAALGAYTVVNADDAPFGAGMFIEGAVKDGKLADPESKAVLDEDGELFDAFSLAESSAAVIIVKEGKVIFAHEGKFTAQDEAKVLELAGTL